MENYLDNKTEQMPRLLLVDDDPLIGDSLGFVLSKHFQVYSAESRPQAKSILIDQHFSPDVALIDLGLPPCPHKPEEGFKLIEDLIAYDDSIKILVLSGQNASYNIEHARTLGAIDFIPKPINPASLKERLFEQLRLRNVESNIKTSSPSVPLVGESEAIVRVQKQIQQFAKVDFPILIEGESGTGKEVIARHIHEASERRTKPFVAINCAALPANLLETQLFGHTKGAFTGAVEKRVGFFDEANEGTLLLDEIGEMPLELQVKLLRVLETGEYYPVGDSKPRHTNARIIAATNKTLKQQVQFNQFREDLYHRLSILTIQSPPLSERGNDRFLLLTHFKSVFKDSIADFTLDEEAAELWGRYDFPGNIRELRNIVIRIATKYPNQKISRDQLADELQIADMHDESLLPNIDSVNGLEERIRKGSLYLDELLEEVEKNCIQVALKLNNNNLSGAARDLHINRSTLHSRMQRHFPQGER